MLYAVIIMTNDEKEAFYAECGRILGIEHKWNTPVARRTRWNARRIGNGRFPGYGLIRVYGSQVMVTNHKETRWFKTAEEVYEYLNNA